MKKLTLLLIALSLFAASPVMATTGSGLLFFCNDAIKFYQNRRDSSTSQLNVRMCIAEVDKAEKKHSHGVQLYGNERLYCTPAGVTKIQKIMIIVKFLNDHPELIHNNADSLIYTALSEVFPCHEP